MGWKSLSRRISNTMTYQSFKPGEGSSDSAGKLQAIRLPKLQGKSFLDLGCNAGFFCQYALDQGASRVVGVDKSSHYTETARNQIPDAKFICSDWDDLEIDGEFDVIIILSALHYANNTNVLLKKVHKLLSKDGVFVFEGGIHPNELYPLWIPVTRGVGTAWYPTRALWEGTLLSDFSFRRVGKSVTQKGDALSRVVYHCRRKLPVWTLVSGEGNSGKSSYVRSLTHNKVVQLDWLLGSNFAKPMHKGDEVIQELSRRLREGRAQNIHEVVNWIDTPRKAHSVASHVIQHLPLETDLIIEGYLLSNKRFMRNFLRLASGLDVRIWHSQKIQ